MTEQSIKKAFLMAGGAYLLNNEIPQKDIVLGTKAVSVDDFMNALIKRFGYKRPFRLKLTRSFSDIIARLLDKRLSDWDRYCLKTYHQTFKTTEPSNLGLKTCYPAPEDIIEDLFGRK